MFKKGQQQHDRLRVVCPWYSINNFKQIVRWIAAETYAANATSIEVYPKVLISVSSCERFHLWTPSLYVVEDNPGFHFILDYGKKETIEIQHPFSCLFKELWTPSLILLQLDGVCSVVSPKSVMYEIITATELTTDTSPWQQNKSKTVIRRLRKTCINEPYAGIVFSNYDSISQGKNRV